MFLDLSIAPQSCSILTLFNQVGIKILVDGLWKNEYYLNKKMINLWNKQHFVENKMDYATSLKKAGNFPVT